VNALSRRAFLAGAAGTASTAAAALAAGGLGSLLAACDSATVNANVRSQSLVPRPYQPVTWPINAGNKPIADGLRAEKNATLAVYSWAGRIAAECLDKFSRRYGCQVKLTTFNSMHEAITTITTRPTRFDVFLGAPIAMLGTLIQRSLIQPLNHSYIPNIRQAWPQFANPFYDQHWQYTVPYTIYTTGVGWRRDQVKVDPSWLYNGWKLLWRPKYNGHVAMLDDYREGIGLGLLYLDLPELSTADPLLLDAAARSLTSLATLVHPKLSNNAATDLAVGTTWLQQAWSGQVAAAHKNLPPGTPGDVLGYWFPASGAGPAGSDTIAIPRSARNPVLAHLLLNFMLDTPNALANTRGTGFMQPLNGMTATRLVREGAVPPSLISTVVLENTYSRGLKELALPAAADALWQQAWQSVVSHMQLSPIG